MDQIQQLLKSIGVTDMNSFLIGLVTGALVMMILRK